MKPFRLTAMLSVFAVALIASAAIGVPIAIEKGAPYRITSSECLVCGRMQTIERRWSQPPEESIEAHKDAIWMARHLPDKHDHWWVPGSAESRDEWFGYSLSACGGGVGGVSLLHYLAQKRGQDIAGPFVQEYLQLVNEGDLESIRSFVQSDVQNALLDPHPQQPVPVAESGLN
ncbi:MAG: hypothetical protein O3B13_25405 [Planctomycetota bacterium]|nr:hypothetical protein [Planctomycetota bacterium]